MMRALDTEATHSRVAAWLFPTTLSSSWTVDAEIT
jgi:hypothetical protein